MFWRSLLWVWYGARIGMRNWALSDLESAGFVHTKAWRIAFEERQAYIELRRNLFATKRA